MRGNFRFNQMGQTRKFKKNYNNFKKNSKNILTNTLLPNNMCIACYSYRFTLRAFFRNNAETICIYYTKSPKMHNVNVKNYFSGGNTYGIREN